MASSALRLRPVLRSTLVGLSVSVGACGDPSGTFAEANNNVRVPLSGFGEVEAFERVSVPVEFVPAPREIDEVRDLELSFSNATVVGDLTTGYAQMYTEVTNTTGTPLCFVEARGIDFFDVNGTVLATDSSFVRGSSAQTMLTRAVIHSCLVEGQTGVFMSIIEDLDPTQVASVRFVVGATDAWQYDRTEADVVPTAIQVASGESNTELTVTLKNQGSRAATLELTRIILFDEGGQFLDWTFAEDPEPGIIATNESSVATSTLLTVHGPPTEALVHVSWDE